MESLRGLPEHIEADFGDSIVARDEALAVLAAAPGLGPPDLCFLQKCAKRTGFFGGNGESQGYYHYVLGRDVASSAAVAAYFALLNSKVEQRTMLQGLWMSTELMIERGFYCCYDAISRLDIRCELCVPGGVVVGCLDAAGQLHDTTPQVWMQVQVSAFVRAMLYDPEMRLNGGSVIAYDPCPTKATETALLTSVLQLYSQGALPGGLQDINEEQGFGVAAEEMDLVLAALWQHFRRRQRWAAAAEFFRQLVQVHSPAALLLAAAERAQGLGLGAGGAATLSELLARPAGPLTPRGSQPLVPATMVGLGHELLEQGDAEAAAGLARRALAVCPRCRPAWLLLARCFVRQRQYAAALLALNVVPTPPLPAAEVELLHVVPPPAPKATTQPQGRLYDAELEAARWCALEEASLDGSRLLAYLPGSILVNKEPLGTGYQPDVCPNRITRSVLTAVYELLQIIVKDITWDKFLEVRSRVFLMQHEVAPSPQHNNGGLKQGFSTEITPHGQDLAALQAAQQAALLRKLEQLGLHGDNNRQSSPSTTAALSAASTPIATAPAAGSVGGVVTEEGTTPAGSAAGVTPVQTRHSADSPTPPASRGRLSSAGGAGSHRGGGSPQSYYASKLQEELARPHATPPGSSGGGSAAGAAAAAAAHSQLAIRVPGEQQQQQQHGQPVHPAAASPRTVPTPGSVGSTASGSAPAPRAPGTPGVGQRSMAGRVLLLGKKTQPRSEDSSRPPSARSVAPVGCGVPRSLSPNEVEDLSKYATASKVVALRVPGAPGGVTPELWSAVFGGAGGGGGSGSGGGSGAAGNGQQTPAEAAPGAAADVAGRQAHSSDDSDDGLSAAAAGLPRIRTRPLGEQVEEECWPAAAGVRSAAGSVPCRYSSSMSTFLHRTSTAVHDSGSHSCGCSSSNSSSRSRGLSWKRLWRSHASTHKGSRCSSSVSSRPQPLGEGLDRQASLLNRTPSTASVGLGGGDGSQTLPRMGSLRAARSGSMALHGAASGSLMPARSRQLSLVGESANRSLEVDREGLCKGWVHDDASAQAGWGGVDGVGSPGAGGRRLCVRWLDELIVALWHDLQAHMEWKVVDQTLRDTRGGTAAELVLGMAPATVTGSPLSSASATTSPMGGGGGVSDGGAFEMPVLTCADWMRRGALAERLGHTLDARSAYRAAVKLSFNLTSYHALMRLEAEAESISNTALCASQILGWHQQRAGQSAAGDSGAQGSEGQPGAASSSASAAAAGGSGSDHLVVMGMPPGEVCWAMGMVADSTSIEEVRRGMSDAAPAAQAKLTAVLDEWQRWQHIKVQPTLAARPPLR